MSNLLFIRKSKLALPTLSIILMSSGCSKAPPKWEYKTESVDSISRDKILAERGSAGWELVSTQIHKKASQAEISALDAKINDFPTLFLMHMETGTKISQSYRSVREIFESDTALMQNVGKDQRKVTVVLDLMEKSHTQIRNLSKYSKDAALFAVALNEHDEAMREGKKFLETLHEREDAESEVVDLSFKRQVQ